MDMPRNNPGGSGPLKDGEGFNQPEVVDHPGHYNAGKLEVIEVIRDQDMHVDFCLGNALKYIMRAKHKKKFIEHLEKARWYLDYLIQHPDNT